MKSRKIIHIRTLISGNQNFFPLLLDDEKFFTGKIIKPLIQQKASERFKSEIMERKWNFIKFYQRSAFPLPIAIAAMKTDKKINNKEENEEDY